jgi:hypothetical protein
MAPGSISPLQLVDAIAVPESPSRQVKDAATAIAFRGLSTFVDTPARSDSQGRESR